MRPLIGLEKVGEVEFIPILLLSLAPLVHQQRNRIRKDARSLCIDRARSGEDRCLRFCFVSHPLASRRHIGDER